MAMKGNIQTRAIAVLVVGYIVGLIAYPNLPGPFLDEEISARIMVAFTLPTTALVIYTLFRSLWKHDRIRSGNGAFEATYHAIVLRTLLFVLALHALVMIELTGAMDAYLSTVSNRLNSVMKQLTIIATVFLPLSWLTGFFGQNFGFMVRHVGRWEAFVGLGVGSELLVLATLLLFFKRRGWF